MGDSALADPRADERTLRAEIFRLNKIVRALMNRAERSADVSGSDFSSFQTAIMLEDEVRRRTSELEAALRENDRINRALRESEAKFRGLVNQSLAGILVIEEGRSTYANPKLAEILGYTVEEFMRIPPLDHAIASDRPRMEEEFRRRLSGEVERVQYEFRGRHKNGSVIDIECHGSCMDIGGRPALISLLIDVTERTRAWREIQELQVKLREQALHDPLTGLFNRQSLSELVDREIRLAECRRYPISMVMGDLDHFKAINDNYGHLVGDEVLRVFSELVKRSYRASDIYFRYGGEEFLIVLPGMFDVAAVERTELLRFAVQETAVVIGAAVVNITASFGVATFPQHGMTCDALIAAADRAMYAAKNAGRNQVISASEDLQVQEFSEAPDGELQADRSMFPT